MSATNRNGLKRIEHDFYPTPVDVVSKFLNYYNIKDGNILEPSAGNGHFLEALRINGYLNNITSVEIRSEEKENLIKYGKVFIDDFLTWQPDKKYKTIITNPPYSLALPFLEKCFEISEKDTEIIMLLRLSFLESKKRYEFWKKHPLSELYVLSQRPSFTGKGTDATSYCFMIWNNSNIQKIDVIL